MGSIEENRELWSNKYGWPGGGDEWSAAWGSTAMEWYGSLMPRLHLWLPAKTILEIAPGFGRWTQFLKDLGQRLIIVDLSERCIIECQERFADADNISYHVNDGRSLSMVEDSMVDFAFSFDSLVHVEADVIEAYLRELARTLAADGVAFIHHSNVGAYRRRLARGRLVHRITRRHRRLKRLGARITASRLAYGNPEWRAESVTADLVDALCRDAGLECRSQELVNWGSGPLLIDCFSVITRPGSRWALPRVVRVNPRFMDEAGNLSAIDHVYGAVSGAE
jgi:ubiquinone/menaquinone biosynthesis C-methylase UbiE